MLHSYSLLCCAGDSNFFPLVLATSRNPGILYMQTVRTDIFHSSLAASPHNRIEHTWHGIGVQTLAQRLWDKGAKNFSSQPWPSKGPDVHALRHRSAEFLLLGCTTCPWHSSKMPRSLTSLHWRRVLHFYKCSQYFTLLSYIMAMGNLLFMEVSVGKSSMSGEMVRCRCQ